MIVAPTEPKKLRDAATSVNLYPESLGADILIISKSRKIGIQRKELKDLIASLSDGRLGMQLQQMAGLDVAVLLIEGQPKFSMDGELMNGSGYGRPVTEAQYQGVIWSAHLRGIWVDHTGNLDGTITWLERFEKWLSKDRHTSLVKREKVVGAWGTADNIDFQRHLLMGIPGVGFEMADRILKEVGMPLGLKDGMEGELGKVKGLGPKKLEQIVKVFG